MLVCARLLRFVLALFPVEDSVSVITAQGSGNTVSRFRTEQTSDAGTLVAPQLPTLPLQYNLEDSSSFSTTVQGKETKGKTAKCIKL